MEKIRKEDCGRFSEFGLLRVKFKNEHACSCFQDNYILITMMLQDRNVLREKV